MEDKYIKNISRILRTSEEVIFNMEEKMERVTGKKGIIEKIGKEMEEKINERLRELGFFKKPEAEVLYRSLLDKALCDDKSLFSYFGSPDLGSQRGCSSIVNSIYNLIKPLNGFYLKKEKARDLLYKNPPKSIMNSLGYGSDIRKMLDNEDVIEIFCALRFAEDPDWLNNIFFRSYENLSPEDFEIRETEARVLPERWRGVGQRFLGKKLHHMSHLKELGVVFVIPVPSLNSGEVLYLFFMVLHYLYEVHWHSLIFEMMKDRKDFSKKLISILKVETSSFPLPDKNKISWRIVNTYLGKKNMNDSRLFEPHISPEVLHYTNFYKVLDKFSKQHPELELDFWKDLGWVADYFYSKNLKKDILVSFDLFDVGISLLRNKPVEEMYLYHFCDALWNKIFTEYMGEEFLDRIMRERLLNGYVEFSKNDK